MMPMTIAGMMYGKNEHDPVELAAPQPRAPARSTMPPIVTSVASAMRA